MRPIPATSLGHAHGLLRAIDKRGRLRTDEFVTEFSLEELFPPDLENALGRLRHFISYGRAAGLVKEDRGVVELTDVGRRYIRAGDPDAPFAISSQQAEWLRRQLREKHMTDSIFHGLAIGLSLLASCPPGSRVATMDFGRSMAYLGRAGWDNDNTLLIQGERHLLLLTDMELIDGEHRLTPTGELLRSELTLPVHMGLIDLAAQLNPGGADAVRAAAEEEWAPAAPAPAAAAEPVEEQPEPEDHEENGYQTVGRWAVADDEAPRPPIVPRASPPRYELDAPHEGFAVDIPQDATIVTPKPASAAVPVEPPAPAAPPAITPGEPAPPASASPADPAPPSAPPPASPADPAPVASAPPPASPADLAPVASASPAGPVAPDPSAPAAPPSSRPEMPAAAASAPPPEAVAPPSHGAAPPAAGAPVTPDGPASPPPSSAAAGRPPEPVAPTTPDPGAAAWPPASVPPPASSGPAGPPRPNLTVIEPMRVPTAVPSFVEVGIIRAAAEAAGMRLPATVYANVASALNAGKHLLLTGERGAGKTWLALAVARAAAQAGKARGATVVTGRPPLETIVEAAARGRWVIVDELNQIEPDEALGFLSSLLAGVPVTFEGEEVTPADGWRIVATWNGGPPRAAILRRFAVIDVLPPEPAELQRLLQQAASGDPASVAAAQRLAETGLGTGVLLDAARHAAARNAVAPTDEPTLAREVFDAYAAPLQDP